MTECYEIFLVRKKRERSAELEHLKQSEESRSFAWMACYAISKPAKLLIDENDGNPRLCIDYSQMTPEVSRNCFLHTNNNNSARVSTRITLKTPKVMIKTSRSPSENEPYKMPLCLNQRESNDKFMSWLSEMDGFLQAEAKKLLQK